MIVRSGAEMAAVLAGNPFHEGAPAKVGVAFLTGPLGEGARTEIVIPGWEEVVLGRREAYVHFPDGMGGRLGRRLWTVDTVGRIWRR